MDGAHVRAEGYGTLEVTVTCRVRGRGVDAVSELRRQLASALCSDEPEKLVLPDEPAVYLMAYYEGGASLSRLHDLPQVQLKFLCPDPIALGEHRVASIDGTSRVQVGGTYRTLPTVTASPPAGDSWQVTRVSTGEFVRVSAPFDGTQEVVLDMAAQRCTVNGKDHRVDIESDFFCLEGTEDVSVSAGAATLEWDERWL